MSPGPEIQEVARRLVGVLDTIKAPYAVGGAVAMAFAGYVRATIDIDVLAMVPALRFQDFADLLGREGFVMRDARDQVLPPDPRLMSSAGRDLGHFRVWRGDTRAEVFIPKVPLQDSVLRRKVLADLGDFKMWITTAEDLILLKMVFHRPKDLVNL